MKRIFEKAVSRFYHNRSELPFTVVYDLMLKEYYTNQAILPDGHVHLQLKPQDGLPSIGQFRFWYSKTHNETSKIAARKGESAFLRNHRAILGKSDTNTVDRGLSAKMRLSPSRSTSGIGELPTVPATSLRFGNSAHAVPYADWESKFRDKCLDEIRWLQESEKG